MAPPPPPPETYVVVSFKVLVADTGNHAIRHIVHDESNGQTFVRTLAGDGAPGNDDSLTRLEKPRASVLLTSILDARFVLPTAVACADYSGGAVVADSGNHRLRQIRSDGVTVTVAGGSGRGLKDGEGDGALFNGPTGVARDLAGYGDRFVVSERHNAALRNVYLHSEGLNSAAGSRRGDATTSAVAFAATLAVATAVLMNRFG